MATAFQEPQVASRTSAVKGRFPGWPAIARSRYKVSYDPHTPSKEMVGIKDWQPIETAPKDECLLDRVRQAHRNFDY